MSTPPPIIYNPGSATDPQRVECFRAIQVALAGSQIGTALAAQIDSLAAIIIVAARDPANAEDIIVSLGRDLQRDVKKNWELVKSQLVHSMGEGSRA